MEVVSTPFLSRKELSERWGMSPRTLENWAVQGKGPKYRRFGHRAMYRLSDVEQYEAEVWADDSPKVSA